MRHIILEGEGHRTLGVCSVCGPVEIRYSSGGRYRCLNSVRASRRVQDMKKSGVKVAWSDSFQPSSCEVCGKGGVLSLDHDHSTGRVRGWLCPGCNSALGYAYDNPDTLRSLAAYLER